MRIAIVGWGLEAQSAYRYFGREHDYLIVNETAQDNFPPESDKVEIRHLSRPAPIGIPGQITDLDYLDGIEDYDKIVYQPTAYFNLQKKFGNSDEFWSKATTAYDIFFENSPSKNIIGITGTKGKGTTSTLIARILDVSGETVHLGGNIGTPILDLLPDIKAGDWVVWELANFQLKPAKHSPHIAVALMIVPEHLDWHPNFEDYMQAKANIFKYQKPEDTAIYFPFNESSKRIAQLSPGKKLPYFMQPGAYLEQNGDITIDGQPIINRKDVILLGEHNLQNICAAVTASWQVTKDVSAIRQVLSEFTGLEHRLEFVRELDGVKYYDDSFGTTPETAIVALQAFAQPKIVVLGGSDKGASFGKLAEVVANSNVKQAVVIGQIGGKIIEALKSHGFNNITTGPKTMPEIVDKASQLAGPGDVVLFSTAAASFDMFKDYKDRGNQFKQAVQALS